MSMMNAFRYVDSVDDILQDMNKSLRRQAFALDMPIQNILPLHVRQQDDDYKADHLARQLVFSILTVKKSNRHDLQRILEWVKGIISFMLHNLMEEEHTFAIFLRSYSLDQPIRSELFKHQLPQDAPLRSDKTPPLSYEDMELAIVHTLIVTGQLDPYKRSEPLYQLRFSISQIQNRS